MTTGAAETGRHAGARRRAIEAAPWTSAITSYDRTRVYLRGRPVDELLSTSTFAETVLLLWTGTPASAGQARVLEACLVAGIDHGAITPSAIVARTASSVHQDPVTSVAAGLLTVTALHGGAVTGLMELLCDGTPEEPAAWAAGVAERHHREGRRLPGIGHRVHDDDLRAHRLFDLTIATLGESVYVERARALSAAVSARVGRPIAVNVDGAVAATLATIGLAPVYGNLVFLLSRSAGLAAHVVEERTRERPMRLIDPTQVAYDGPPPPSGTETATSETPA